MPKKHNRFHYLLVILLAAIKNSINIIVWVLVAVVGLVILLLRRGFIGIVVGLPLFLIGIGFMVNSLWTIILGVFSKTYNKAVCILCGLRKIPNKK